MQAVLEDVLHVAVFSLAIGLDRLVLAVIALAIELAQAVQRAG